MIQATFTTFGPHMQDCRTKNAIHLWVTLTFIFKVMTLDFDFKVMTQLRGLCPALQRYFLKYAVNFEPAGQLEMSTL